MRIALTDLERLTGDTYFIRAIIEQLAASIALSWDQQHNNDGTHGALTAATLAVSGAADWQSRVTLSGGPFVAAAGATLNAAPITADQNNYAPIDSANAQITMNTAVVLILTPSGATRTLTGLVAPSPVRQQFVWLLNVGGQSLVLAHASASSTATNWFACPGSANLTVRTNGGVLLYYDVPSVSRGGAAAGLWRVMVN